MPQPLQWLKLKSTGTVPAPRLGHTLVKFDKTYILFGGLDNEKKNGKVAPNNEVYTLKLMQKEQCNWKLESPGGEMPLPRSNHTACSIGDNEMLVFGGLYSSNQRFNDTYILKIGKSYQWRQPPNQKSGQEPKNTESKIGAPEPRANHTATFVPGKKSVYVFGGHGGVGYSRKAFNDVYVLDCANESFEWTKVDPSGNSPEARGGHSACLLPSNKIFINGGWNSISQFANSWLFDIEKKEWSELDLNMEIPRWNHVVTIVPALPKSKIFIFGGSTGYFEEGSARNFGEMSRQVLYMDVLDELKSVAYKKVVPDNDNVLPSTRENSSFVYDQDEQRLVLFGGWSNNYLNDIYQINIGSITGPDYAIYQVNPALGP